MKRAILNDLIPFQRSRCAIWTDPHMRRQLLKLHLDQATDAASRNKGTIEATVKWIGGVLKPRSTVADLGCGPGLYAVELAKAGHRVAGIDCNRASINYARKHCRYENRATYRLGNYLTRPLGSGFDAALMIYCDFGALIPDEQAALLGKVRGALKDGGAFIFDVFGPGLTMTMKEGRTWSCSAGPGLWSAAPHFLLEETRHFPERRAVGRRYFRIAQNTGKKKEFIIWDQYYDERSIEDLLGKAGFNVEKIEKRLIPKNQFTTDDVFFVVARKL